MNKGSAALKIKFTAESGFCPYFIYNCFKFFIQDTKTSNGEYTYSLYMKNINSEQKSFMKHEEAISFVNNIKGIRFIYTSEGRMLYSSVLHEYIIDDKKVIIRSAAQPMSGDFDNYIDCLNFAKQYVERFIILQEPEQIKLSI